MESKIILFGQLTDITGNDTIAVNNISDTDSLVTELNKLYPAMIGVKYIIAIDKKVIQENTVIQETSTIALLPPFSGG
ncbi:MAG: MoaD/ThiS family protein [Chitinophagaceae bacterium]